MICTCKHLPTWHRASDGSGKFVGVNLGACVAEGCGCGSFAHAVKEG